MLTTRRDAHLAGMIHILLLLVYAVTIYSLFIAALAALGLIMLDQMPPWWAHLLGSALIMLSIRPVHSWVRHKVDLLIYGWPDDPYAALSQLQASIDPTSAPQSIVPAAASLIATTLKLPYVLIRNSADGTSTEVGIAPAGAQRITLPLIYGKTIVGSLEVCARRVDTALSSSEIQLLYDLARQVGITLYAAQLSQALQDSRTQLVTAREEERSRIRRDLHDELGPTLAAIRIQLGVARRKLRSEAAAADTLLSTLQSDVIEATTMIRRLVYNLRPPMLDEHGLIGALQSLERQIEPLGLTMELPKSLPQLPAAVEVALYRIASEALHNVARHAQASSCTLQLILTEQQIQLSVADDGIGLTSGDRPGVGLIAMQERAEELGGSLSIESGPTGGLTIRALIPRRSSI